MVIQFNDILPHPIAELPINEESIWKSSFTIHKGEKILLNAASGKGKTTFTEILAGLRKDYSGEVLFDEVNFKTFDLEKWTQFRKNKLSFVFQDLQLFPNQTVKENLELKNQLTGHLKESEVKALLEELGILDKWNVECQLLSMGQQQRVAIIRALCQPFDWIVLDEPFSHLDKENTVKALKVIEEFVLKQNAGMILTTLGEKHNFNFDKELFL